MEQVLINLYIPSLGQKYDVFIPTFLTFRELCGLLGEGVETLSQGQYRSSGQEFLCSLERNQILREECRPKDYQIQNGEHLILC